MPVRVTVACMKAILGVAGVLAAATILFASTDASAAGHANGFGEKGQLILSADRFVPVFSYTSSSITRTENNIELTRSRSGSGLSLLLGRSLADNQDFAVPINVHALPRVAFDITIIPRLTLGGGDRVRLRPRRLEREPRPPRAPPRPPGGRTLRRGRRSACAPRVGYILPLSDIFAFWPRAGFGFYSVSASTRAGEQQRRHDDPHHRHPVLARPRSPVRDRAARALLHHRRTDREHPDHGEPIRLRRPPAPPPPSAKMTHRSSTSASTPGSAAGSTSSDRIRSPARGVGSQRDPVRGASRVAALRTRRGLRGAAPLFLVAATPLNG